MRPLLIIQIFFLNKKRFFFKKKKFKVAIASDSFFRFYEGPDFSWSDNGVAV